MFKKREEFNYFDEFSKSVNYAEEATKRLKEYIYNFDVKNVNSEMNYIHEIENNADKNLHELKNYLLKDFLPPIDREDILNISHRIDDVVDDIDEVIIDINILNVTKIREDVKPLMDLLEETMEKVCELVKEFKNMKKSAEIKEKIIGVNKLEEQADKLYEKAIKDLYKNEKDAIHIIKWTSIYRTIEDCFDACENVADCIEEVLMKNT